MMGKFNLHRVGQVQKALKPSTSVNVSKKVKLKFKAKVLQRQARFIVANPWMDYTTDGYGRASHDEIGEEFQGTRQLV